MPAIRPLLLLLLVATRLGATTLSWSGPLAAVATDVSNAVPAGAVTNVWVSCTATTPAYDINWSVATAWLPTSPTTSVFLQPGEVIQCSDVPNTLPTHGLLLDQITGAVGGHTKLIAFPMTPPAGWCGTVYYCVALSWATAPNQTQFSPDGFIEQWIPVTITGCSSGGGPTPTPVATAAPAPSFPVLQAVMPVPNPAPRYVDVLTGLGCQLEVRVYTAAMTCVSFNTLPVATAGWHLLSLNTGGVHGPGYIEVRALSGGTVERRTTAAYF